MNTNAELDALAIANDARQGDVMLRKVEAFLRRFVSYPSEHALTAHLLWIAHAHLMDKWDSTPRLAFLSAEPSSGKTRALEITELLVPRPMLAVNLSPAYIFRKVGDEQGLPTILYDEIDTVFGPKAKENEEIRGLLNAGHRRGAKAGRCVVRGKTVLTEEIQAYSALALAGIGWLPDTILSRSVIIRMRRRKAGERVEPYRRRLHASQGEEVRQHIETWANYIRNDDIEWPELPSEIQDRDADIWEPLIAIADAAGGDWPTRARKAAVALVAVSKDVEPSLGILLLAHMQIAFGEAEKLPTEVILKRLHELPEAPWNNLKGKPLDDRGLARRLREYGIKPRVLRIGEATPRGYERKDFADGWERYLPSSSLPATSATSATPKSAEIAKSEFPFKNEWVTVAGAKALPTNGACHVADVADVARLRDGKGELRPPCAQCNQDDGEQYQHQPKLWLHRQCVRFWERGH
jgi:hypothetical protein